MVQASVARDRSSHPATGKSDLPRAQHTLKRILTILKTMVSHLDILETMTPTEFLSFQEFLASSSGFQSA